MTIEAAQRVNRDGSGLSVEDYTAKASRHADFADHELVLVGRDPDRGLMAIIAVHSTRLGPAIGGTRIWAHPDFDTGLADVLRLSHGMTQKAAVAGLAHGGGKAIILADARTDKTPAMLSAYAEMLARVRDIYYTAEDVGLTLADADFLRQRTANVLGTTQGGSGNPSPVTAHGVYLGLKAAVRHRLRRDGVAGLTVAVQGLGAVGSEVARRAHVDGARLIVADIEPTRLETARQTWGATVVASDEVAFSDAHVFSPCALGGVLNAETIPAIRARVVAGAANNQLATIRDAERLRQLGILYAPDYVINAAGLMNVAAELEPGGYDRARVFRQIETIPAVLSKIFERADTLGLSTESVAAEMAAERLRTA